MSVLIQGLSVSRDNLTKGFGGYNYKGLDAVWKEESFKGCRRNAKTLLGAEWAPKLLGSLYGSKDAKNRHLLVALHI